MIKIIDGRIEEGRFLEGKEYYCHKGSRARFIIPLTKRLRSAVASRYVSSGENLLDIGCGDGHFLRRVKCRNRFGLDLIYGDELETGLDFRDNFFNYVTMLAVIEHLNNPEFVVTEVHRVLKPEGKFIFTTPKRSAERYIRIVAPDIEDRHETYFDRQSISNLCRIGFELETYRTFLFGLNQIAVLKKQ